MLTGAVVDAHSLEVVLLLLDETGVGQLVGIGVVDAEAQRDAAAHHAAHHKAADKDDREDALAKPEPGTGFDLFSARPLAAIQQYAFVAVHSVHVRSVSEKGAVTG